MKTGFFRLALLAAIGILVSSCHHNSPKQYDGWKLIWNDEFNIDGPIDEKSWNVEERQIYDTEGNCYLGANVFCKDGVLTIEGKKENDSLPDTDRKDCCTLEDNEYTARNYTSVNTRNKVEFQYGRIEICAKIPNNSGAWPAVWTLGTVEPWLSSGEIGLLQYYVVDNKQDPEDRKGGPYTTIRNSVPIPLKAFTRVTPGWSNQFHVWRIDWDMTSISFYLDDKLINKLFLSKSGTHDFGRKPNSLQSPHFILFNLSRIMSDEEMDRAESRLHYEIDYIRVYQKEKISQ